MTTNPDPSPASSDTAATDRAELRRILGLVVSLLDSLTPNERDTLIRTVLVFFGTPDRIPSQLVGPHFPSRAAETDAPSRHSPSLEHPGHFSEDRSMTPKQFMIAKMPQSDVERVTCLAHYLTHYRGMSEFQTIDVSKLNTEAAQPKLSNPTMAISNAIQRGYILQRARGSRQLSAAGERFVNALPDRAAAKAAVDGLLPRRRRATKNDSDAAGVG